MADIVVCDASFIGLRTVLPAALLLTKPEAYLIALIKPAILKWAKSASARKALSRDPGVAPRSMRYNFDLVE